MNFQKFCGLRSRQIHGSRLSEIPESAYRSPDVDRARLAWEDRSFLKMRVEKVLKGRGEGGFRKRVRSRLTREEN